MKIEKGKQIISVLRKKKLLTGVFVLLFLFVFPHLINERIQAGQILWSKQGPSLPGKDNKEIAQLLQKMLKEAERNPEEISNLQEPEDLSEEEETPQSGEVIYLGKALNEDKRFTPKRENNEKSTPAVVIPGKEEEKPPAEESPEPSAEAPQDDLRLIAPGQGSPVGPNPPGNNPPGNNPPGNNPGQKPSPKPGKPPAPPFRWKFADPNRPNFKKIKLEDARPSSLSPEEIRELQPGKDYKPGEVLIKYKNTTSASEIMGEGMSLKTAIVYD
ncbi:MAG: hypothetical protein NC920_03655, partial [Candidatus Omnitrophica bacterium]|nr:hypothetical protein [Candidatus Omnitrophota bacterium]